MEHRRAKVAKSKIRLFEPEEAKRFAEVVKGDRYEALYITALTTGMRKGELMGLKWSDVDLDPGRITVNHAFPPTKRRKEETRER